MSKSPEGNFSMHTDTPQPVIIYMAYNLSNQSTSRIQAQVHCRWMLKTFGRGPPATKADNIWFPN